MHRIRLIKHEALEKINATNATEPVADITSPKDMDVLKVAASLANGYPTTWRIANELRLSTQTTQKRLNDLMAAGLLEVSKRGNFNYYYLTPTGKKALARSMKFNSP
jgi:Mn-dependent DtxR family transcriptional regulator